MRHCPAVGLVLPPAYNDVGVFSLKMSDELLPLVHRRLQEEPDELQNKVKIDGVVFENNHSESMVCLVVSPTHRYHRALSFPHASAALALDAVPHHTWLSEQMGGDDQTTDGVFEDAFGRASQACYSQFDCRAPC